MKLIILGLYLVGVALAGDEFSIAFKEKFIAKVQEIGMGCASKEDANGDDIGQLMNRQTPTRREGKCMIACFDQEYGLMDKDGKFDIDGITKAVEPFKKESESIGNKVFTWLVDCTKEVKSADRCDAAAEMATCLNANAEKAGLTIDLIM